MLSGEGGPYLGCPNVLNLPASIYQSESIATMTVKQFSAKVTEKGTTYSYPLLVLTSVCGTTELLQIAPILPFLVYDCFEKDLDAAEVFKRVLVMDRERVGQETTLNLHNFLLS